MNYIAQKSIEDMETIYESQSASYELMPKTIGELVEGYGEDAITGKVTGFNGKLIINPEFQRDYIYKEKQRQAVIETIINGAPLSNMYWAKRGDSEYECLDGRQRSQSICQFVKGEWTVNFRGNQVQFRNLPRDIRERILNYELQVYEVNGSESDKIRWFRTINIPGSPLTEQELRNSIFTGTWLKAAKAYFSNPSGGAANRYGHLTGGIANRQEILEVALYWITGSEEGIELYMGEHQDDEDASELITYFKKVCAWVEEIIGEDEAPARVKLGKTWGDLYRKYHETFVIDREEIDKTIDRLIRDDEVNEKPKGFYPYVITKDIKELFQRQFNKTMKEKKYREQNGICPVCGGHFTLNQMQADHVKPWSDGGKTTYENLQMLCQDCNGRKSNGIC